MPDWTALLLAMTPLAAAPGPLEPRAVPMPGPRSIVECPGRRPRLLGFASRPLSLSEMVVELERGCLALEDVHFRPGQDTIESLSPAALAEVARAIGLAQGEYRVTVPPERTAGLPPDTLQARRRSTRLRDELVHYGAAASRLLEDPGWPISPLVVAPGAAVPMLIRVPDP